MNSGAIDPRRVSAEIIEAFRDAQPPDSPEDFIPYDPSENVDYLYDKTWFEIANSQTILKRFSEDGVQYYFLSKELFLYLLPGFLLAVINNERMLVNNIAYALMDILSPADYRPSEWVIEIYGESAYLTYDAELFSYVLDTLTSSQKKAVAHWLKLEMEQDRERRPQFYSVEAEQTKYQVAFSKWRQWCDPQA